MNDIPINSQLIQSYVKKLVYPIEKLLRNLVDKSKGKSKFLDVHIEEDIFGIISSVCLRWKCYELCECRGRTMESIGRQKCLFSFDLFMDIFNTRSIRKICIFLMESRDFWPLQLTTLNQYHLFPVSSVLSRYTDGSCQNIIFVKDIGNVINLRAKTESRSNKIEAAFHYLYLLFISYI